MTELTHTELCGTGNLSLPLERHQKPRLHHVLKSSGQHILASQQPPAPRLSYLHPTPTVSGKLSASSVSRPENLPPFVVPSKRVTTTGRVKCLKHMLVVTVLYLKHSSPFPSIYSIKSKLLSSALRLPRSDLPPPPPSPKSRPSSTAALPHTPSSSLGGEHRLPHTRCGVCPRHAFMSLQPHHP